MKKVPSFNIYRTECPVCGTPNEFKGVKPKAFVETGRDTDFCPLGREWHDSRHQVKNPLLYFMATCKKCFFTHELTKELIEWNKSPEFNSPAFAVLKREHLVELNKKNGVIKKLGKALRPSKDPFSSAVFKFLLGIYDENLRNDPSSYSLGRYYLRIGWLFRGEKQKEEHAWIKENLTPQSFEETLESVADQHEDYLKKIQELKDLAELEFTSGEVEPENNKVKSRMNVLIDHIIKELTSLKDSIDQLQFTYQKHQRRPHTKIGNSFLRFEDFLFSLKMQWSEVSINEKEALELSLGNYKKSLTRNLNENQKIQISYLLGELSRRIGDLNSARDYFDLAINVGEHFIQKNEDDQLKTALAQKILEMAYQQKKIISGERERV